MRKEKRAALGRSSPIKIPVAIVAPLRDKPGSTATACAIPIPSEVAYVGWWRIRAILTGRLVSVSRKAVSSNIAPTKSKLPVKSASNWSLKRKPTMATGIIETIILRMYSVSQFHRKAKSPRISCQISLQRATIVLRTVAPCSATVKVRLSSPLIPNSTLPNSRCPLLLMGRNSVNP